MSMEEAQARMIALQAADRARREALTQAALCDAHNAVADTVAKQGGGWTLTAWIGLLSWPFLHNKQN